MLILKKFFKSFFFRIIVPTVLTIILFFSAIRFVVIPRFEDTIMQGKKEMIKQLTNTTWSILEEYENDEKQGKLTKNQAQKLAIDRIRFIRYGEDNKDYFWITDMQPIMIMHPYRKDLDSTDLTEFKDPHGKRLFVEFVDTVKRYKQGFVNYYWQWKDDSTHIVPKLSYVRGFEPWGWIVGTGIYLEDVSAEISRLTWQLYRISLMIFAGISILLLIIMQQSLVIEKMRRATEVDLQKSKEKYKTLVEAATEGILMVDEDKITYANNYILDLLEYKYDEISRMGISNLFTTESYDKIKLNHTANSFAEGKYEISLITATGNIKSAVVTISTFVLNERKGYILTFKDITIKAFEEENDLWRQKSLHQLINTMKIGLFSTSVDLKGNLIEANEAVFEILEAKNHAELFRFHVYDFFVENEDRLNLKKQLLNNGYICNRELTIRSLAGNIKKISISLQLNQDNASNQKLCYGIMLDITEQIKQKKQTEAYIQQLNAANLFFYNHLENYFQPITYINASQTIEGAFKILSEKNENIALVINEQLQVLGMLDFETIIFKLQEENNRQMSVTEIMLSPVPQLQAKQNIVDFILLKQAKPYVKAVVIKEQSKILGIIKFDHLLHILQQHPILIENKIQLAKNITDLAEIKNIAFHSLADYVFTTNNAENITSRNAEFSDKIIQKVIDDKIAILGEPPCLFSFITLGSEGRGEQTLVTDQDNAIIFADSNSSDEALHQVYFLRLAEMINESLHQIGYEYCKGDIMAKNPRWCQPLHVWKKYFRDWIVLAEPQNLLEISIFFDYKNVYGTYNLVEDLTKYLHELIPNQTMFFYHMANNVSHYKPPVGLLGSIKADANIGNDDTFNIKNAITPMVMFARVYAMYHKIEETNTIKRLQALKYHGIFNDVFLSEFIFNYNYLMLLRLKHQAFAIKEQLKPSNNIQPKRLLELEHIMLKKIFSQITQLQTKLNLDFKGSHGIV